MFYQLVKFCNDNYKNTEECIECKRCTDKNNFANCITCLQEIFRDSNQNRHYDCKNITRCYFCKHGYQYASEISKVMRRIQNFRDLSELNILSIGCGPCTDLLGIINYNDNLKLEKTIKYIGVETNPIWDHIHSFILQNSEVSDISFYNENITRNNDILFKTIIDSKINIIIFHYMISDMVKYAGADATRLLLDTIKDEIISKISNELYIIFNDINHNTKSRDHFEYLLSIMRKDNLVLAIKKLYFEIPNMWDVQRYGDKYINEEIVYEVDDEILKKFKPHQECRSAQLVIRKV